MNRYFSSYVGILSFLSSPHLWLRPLVVTAFLWIANLAIASFVLIQTWPLETTLSYSYFHAVTFSLGLFFLTLLVGWSFFWILLYDIGLFNVSTRNLHDVNAHPQPLRGGQILKMTLFTYKTSIQWKVLWLLLTGIALWVFPILSLFSAAIGIGHATHLSAVHAGLCLQNFDEEKRKSIVNGDRIGHLLSGITSGLVILAFFPTLLAPLFIFPGIYSGAIFCSHRLWRQTW